MFFNPIKRPAPSPIVPSNPALSTTQPMASDNFVKVSLTPCTKTAEEVTEPETTSNENDLL